LRYGKCREDNREPVGVKKRLVIICTANHLRIAPSAEPEYAGRVNGPAILTPGSKRRQRWNRHYARLKNAVTPGGFLLLQFRIFSSGRPDESGNNID
jgi:hypothetical protein